MELPADTLLANQKAYWAQCAATIDGMLGGFESVVRVSHPCVL